MSRFMRYGLSLVISAIVFSVPASSQTVEEKCEPIANKYAMEYGAVGSPSYNKFYDLILDDCESDGITSTGNPSAIARWLQNYCEHGICTQYGG